MNQADFIRWMQDIARDYRKRVFSLKELATWSGMSRPAAGMILLRAAKKGYVFRVCTLWVNRIDPPPLLEVALALKSPSYLSFESALYVRQCLSQSPRGGLTLATPGRPGCFETPLGPIHFFHLKRELFFGFDDQRIAYPEKAWSDLIYIRGLRARKDIITEEFYLDTLNQRRLAQFQKKFPGWVKTITHP